MQIYLITDWKILRHPHCDRKQVLSYPRQIWFYGWKSYRYMISRQEIFHRTARFLASNFYFFVLYEKVTTFIKLIRVNGHEFNTSSMFKYYKDHLHTVTHYGWYDLERKLSWSCVLKDLTYGVIFMQAYIISVTSRDLEKWQHAPVCTWLQGLLTAWICKKKKSKLWNGLYNVHVVFIYVWKDTVSF
jgi:hypothetical protein